jgi:copper chaperone CopZ
VRRTLERVAGVRTVSVNFSAGTAIVQYEKGQVSVGDMVEALRRRGYQARLLGASGG